MSWHDTQHPISWLQNDVTAGQHIEVAATYSRHLATGTSAHIDAAQGAAHQSRVGHHKAPEIELVALVGEGALGDVPEVLDSTIDVVRVSDHQHLITDVEVVVGGGQSHLTVA